MPLFLISCTPPPDPWKDAKPGQKRVLVSFPPLYSITTAIAGDKAYVLSMLTTQGPHHYEGTQIDVFKINKADLYIYTGLTLDDAFNKYMFNNQRNLNLQRLDIGAALLKKDESLPKKDKFLIYHEERIKHQNPDGSWHYHDHEDPHYWLGIRQAGAMAEIIAEKLTEIDKANAKHYEEGKAAFLKKLDELKAYSDAAFKGKKSKAFVTQHDSFKYFAKTLGKEEYALAIQIQPGVDPDAKSIANLRDKMEKEGVHVIAIEPQYSPAQAEALRDSLKRKGIDITIITLDPLETAPRMKGSPNPDPDFYLNTMRENIDRLSKALP